MKLSLLKPRMMEYMRLEVQLTQECINPGARSTRRLNFVRWLLRKIFGNQVLFYHPTNTFLLILYISSPKHVVILIKT